MLKNQWIAVVAAVVLVGGLAAAASDTPPTSENEDLVLVGRDDRQTGPLHFVLEGKPVRGLYPGATKQMKITVRNTLGTRLDLVNLTARVSSSAHRGCPATAANLQVRRFTGRLPARVAAGGRTELAGTIPVVMPMGASIKCAGTRFTITISGVGHRVGR